MTFRIKIILPTYFHSQEAEELEGGVLFKKLKRARQGYVYPQAVLC